MVRARALSVAPACAATRELNRWFTDWGTGRAIGLPLDAYRRGDEFIAELDIPGVDPESIEVTVERNILEVTAERHARSGGGDQVLVAERPTGRVVRQLFLGEGLATDKVEASYEHGVLTVRIPVAEEAKPHKVQITAGGGAQAVEAGTTA